MEIVIVVFIIFAAFVIIGFPLVNPKRYRLAGNEMLGVEQFDDLYNERDRALDALRDLQAEHTTGKLSDGDYQMLRVRYESKAAAVLQQIDALEGVQPKRSMTRKDNAKDAHACPRCHARVEIGDQFCFECGYKL